MRGVMRVRRYALRTERSYCDWVRRYVKFHAMTRREDLAGGTARVEAFLTHLAVAGNVVPSTQNQALNALVFLYGQVLDVELGDLTGFQRVQRLKSEIRRPKGRDWRVEIGDSECRGPKAFAAAR